MDIGGDVFSMSLALTLQRVAPPTAEAAQLRLSDVPLSDGDSSNVGYENSMVWPTYFIVHK